MFEPGALAKIVAETLPPPAQAQLAVVGTVDQTGAQVVVGFTSQAGQWTVSGMYRHEWATGNNTAEAKLMFKF